MQARRAPQNVIAIAEAMRRAHGPAFARRWLEQNHTPTPIPATPTARRTVQEPLGEHPSHTEADQLLKGHREALGAAYETIHAIARWSIENATEEDPAPHLLTTYWTLEEITGKTERTLIRHLVEDGHPWSETVRHLIDVRQCYGEMLQGDTTRPCIVGTIIRFFPRGRQSPNARVKRWAQRDLIEEADMGRTKPTRRRTRYRYQRGTGRMSVHTPVTTQAQDQNWLMIKVGRAISTSSNFKESSGNLYADIPRTHVLDALRADLQLSVEQAAERGANIKRARARWVELAGDILAKRFDDDKPPSNYVHTTHPNQELSPTGPIGYEERDGRFYPVHANGFTNLWRKALWTAIRGELYGNSQEGWRHLQRFVMHADEGERAGKHNPTAWAWTIIKHEGFEELLRDYDTGAVA
jgi:hypothetical protein